jgi:hypothetical protein
MDVEDFLEPEVGIAAAVVATVASPQVRRVVRKGAVYGLAGVLMAGDAVVSFARGVGQGAQRVAQNASAAGSAAAQRVPILQQDSGADGHRESTEDEPAAETQHTGEPS